MSQEKNKYILLKSGEGYNSYYDDCVHFTQPNVSDVPLIWELTREEMYDWTNLFRQVKRYEGWIFVEVVIQDQVTVDQMWADLAKIQAREAEAERKRKEAEQKRKDAAQKKRLAKEAAKLAKDEDLRKAMYEQLKGEFEGTKG